MAAAANFSTTYSENLPVILDGLGVSLAVTTYHAGKLALVRRNPAGVIDLNFTSFKKPMGLAVKDNLLAVACESEIIEFALEGGRYREVARHNTGAQMAHELGYWHDKLIYVNTLCSCVCDLRRVPICVPGFIHVVRAGDHCHLNGLCMVDGEPRWATAHAATNKKSGWRDIKNDGVLIDLTTGEVVVDGLSLPHSPRWHNGVLWLCESGTGTLGIVDLQHGTYEPIVHVEGFTRGLTFAGGLAFVGLSKARGSMFDCDLKDRVDLQCAVHMVDTIAGESVGGIILDGNFEEVFSVEVIPHGWPEVA
jgi:uncharacterized protein (TIGR03032 family)